MKIFPAFIVINSSPATKATTQNRDNLIETTSDNMEQETLFTASKWDILTELMKKERSPMELAKVLNTSVANISQQLRLLEMAGLVESKRISNREKGLPRILYSLSGNHSYLIATAKEFVDKKFHKLTDRNKVVLRIWFLDDPAIHYFLEKAFWRIDDHFADMEAIFLDKKSADLRLLIVSENENLRKKIKDMVLSNPDGKKKKVFFTFLKKEDVDPKKYTEDNYFRLYDPECLVKDKLDNNDDKNGDNR